MSEQGLEMCWDLEECMQVAETEGRVAVLRPAVRLSVAGFPDRSLGARRCELFCTFSRFLGRWHEG